MGKRGNAALPHGPRARPFHRPSSPRHRFSSTLVTVFTVFTVYSQRSEAAKVQRFHAGSLLNGLRVAHPSQRATKKG
jgi:hypothetical protein